ncbi:hypothetical protein 7F23_58 [uncultured Caudovirales phage]|uniref:DUF4352 domain-containing protein n=1 Tax=uncultured Caudovirales phage TaxID=2100421 RepID=A0A2H4JAT0_9CAUD|nr:hypothetical protein 7F23_58 [uncultured Caudovirales phage]
MWTAGMKRKYGLVFLIIIIILVSSVLTWTFSNYKLVDKGTWEQAKRWNANLQTIKEKEKEISQLKNQLGTKKSEIDKNKDEIDDLNEQISDLNEKFGIHEETVSTKETTNQVKNDEAISNETDNSNETNDVDGDEKSYQVEPSIETQSEDDIYDITAGLVPLPGPLDSIDVNFSSQDLYSVVLIINNNTSSSLNLRRHNFSLIDASGENIGLISDDAHNEFYERMEVVPTSGSIPSNSVYKGYLFFTVSKGEKPYSITWNHDGDENEVLLDQF